MTTIILINYESWTLIHIEPLLFWIIYVIQFHLYILVKDLEMLLYVYVIVILIY